MVDLRLRFPVDERGTVKSVVQYFEEIYGFTIHNMTWPCLQVGNPQSPNYLPMETVDHNAYNEDPYAEEFGIKISEKLALVEACVLPAPWLNYHDTGREKDCLPRAGQRNMMNKIFSPEPVLCLLCARPDQVERALKAHFHVAIISILQPDGKELNLVIIILPDNNGPLYGDLKRICETDIGLVSQCCLAKHVFRMSEQYLADVALKINVKVVASRDWPEVTKYAGLVCAQPHRQESIQDLFKVWQDPQRGTVTGGMVKVRLISFKRATGQKPRRIIFYSSKADFHVVICLLGFSGTVVDSKICHPTEIEFYLCSHAGHPMPPAYDAHLAAFRAQVSMEQETSDGG
ncbi:hypothetical protein MUK42_34091 [Musa troglodytarum]|uniref:Piwi domain-containing protein n=1 Tax=Musa troglodytarum TaxID=320322 RepID=A0A9E7GKC3_9LILI|nr:hypothetical protein MUK42_34091 [Musa troglodytarum]